MCYLLVGAALRRGSIGLLKLLLSSLGSWHNKLGSRLYDLALLTPTETAGSQQALCVPPKAAASPEPRTPKRVH